MEGGNDVTAASNSAHLAAAPIPPANANSSAAVICFRWWLCGSRSARAAIEQQIADLDRKVMRLARNNAGVKHAISFHRSIQSGTFVFTLSATEVVFSSRKEDLSLNVPIVCGGVLKDTSFPVFEIVLRTDILRKFE